MNQEHTWVIDYPLLYLKVTPDLGVKFTPNPNKSFECYADAYYWGNWSRTFSETDPSNDKSLSV